jgi:hypothetical protein
VRSDAHGGPVRVLGGQCVGDLFPVLPTESRRGDVAVGRPRCGAHVPVVAGVRRWRLAPEFVTPTTSLHELPGPVKREADSRIGKPGKGFDIDNNRSLLGHQQEVRHMLADSPIDRRLQEKRLREDTAHRDVEVRIQQPRQL